MQKNVAPVGLNSPSSQPASDTNALHLSLERRLGDLEASLAKESTSIVHWLAGQVRHLLERRAIVAGYANTDLKRTLRCSR